MGDGSNSMPSGNGYIVYPDADGPIDSVRSHLQRMGAEDAELLMQLKEKDSAKAEEIIRKLCRTFDDYTRDGLLIDKVRIELLEALSK